MNDENDTGLNLIFPTPVWTFHIDGHPALNEKLYRYIKTLQESDAAGKQISNINGWHSGDFDPKDENVALFMNTISPEIGRVIGEMGWDVTRKRAEISNMWAVVNTRGCANAMHLHSNCFLSAAYYVRAPEGCGDIVFHDPRQAKLIRKPNVRSVNTLNAEEANICPQEGMLVMFPSYLYHSVKENTTDSERVVVSFNVEIK